MKKKIKERKNIDIYKIDDISIFFLPKETDELN